MCWSGSWSIAATALGGAGTVYAAKKGMPKARWMTLGFFTFMELLQALSYIWLDDCGLSANLWLTRTSYIHIAFQIPVVNILALSFISEQRRKKWFKPVMIASFVATLLMLIKLFAPMLWAVPQEWMCKAWQTLCDADTCSYRGNWHIAWRLRLMGFDPLWLIYFIPVFIFPILYGSWRWSAFHFIVGPALAFFLTSDQNEVPAIWCLFSSALLCSIFYEPLRTWFETPMRREAAGPPTAANPN